jgi:ubiquinone/menaquinone biosynthesis C-methylase UbiE
MDVPSTDPEAFRNFERAVHSKNAESYNNAFAAVTDRAIEPLLDAARVGPGTRLLDVASGPGRLAARAMTRGARATGVDLAPAMVALAKRLNPDIEFHEASAEQLPFADGRFDAITCGFGVGHFAEPERALDEFARVLAPYGIVALTWWEGFARNRINGIFHEVIGRAELSAPNALPPGPAVDRFSDRERFMEFLRTAGFESVSVEKVTFRHTVRDADELWDMAMGSFARTSTLIGAQSDVVQQDIRSAVVEATKKYATPRGLEIPVEFLVVSGIRP